MNIGRYSVWEVVEERRWWLQRGVLRLWRERGWSCQVGGTFIQIRGGAGTWRDIGEGHMQPQEASVLKAFFQGISIEFILFVLVLPLVPHDHALAVRSPDPDGPAAVRLELAETDAHATS